MKKLDFTFIAAMLILALTTYNAIDDSLEDDRDEDFYSEMAYFMSRGDRNTATMGFSLCVKQNIHSKKLNTPVVDCCTIYFPDKEECKSMGH